MYPNRYDQSPQIGFTGSEMGGLPTTLDQINPSYYYQISEFIRQRGGRLASFTGLCLYDTLRVDPGVLPSRDFNFYQNAVGQQQGLFVAGTQYTKQEIDVSPWIVGGGTLARGYEALVWSMGVQFHVIGSADDTVQTTGNAIDLPLLIGTLNTKLITDGVSMGNLMRACQESLYFRLFVNSTGFEDGPGWRFPAGEYGAQGFASMGGVTAPAFQIADGYLNNGFGFSYQFPIMRHIPELTKFGVKMTVQNPFSTVGTLNFRVVVTLNGIGIAPITG